MKGNCNTCHGTGFFDGYYKPIEVQIAYDSNPRVAELDQTIEIHSTTIRGRCSCFPIIYTKDMIIGKDGNDRYVVLKVDITKIPNIACKREAGSSDQFHISQILTLAEIPATDPKYNILIDAADLRAAGDMEARIPTMSSTPGQMSHIGVGALMGHTIGVSNG
jgi:hypothetical protein